MFSIAVILAISCVPLALLVGLRLPFLLALGFVLFSFFRLHEAFPILYNLHIPQLLAIGAVGSFVVSLFLQRISFYWREEFTWFLLFFILCTVGILFASNRAVAMSYWTGIYVKIGLMVFIIAWLLQQPTQLCITVRMIIVSGITIALVAIYNKHHSIGLVEGTRVTIGGDIESLLGDPNDLALVLLFAFSFAVSMVLNKNVMKIDKILGVIASLLIVLAIIYTQSRGGLLGLAAVIGTFSWRRVKNKMLLCFVGFCMLSILFVIAGISSRASGGAHEVGLDESANIRLEAWFAAFRMALNNPFTGVGLDNYYYNFYAYSDFWDNKNHAVHSTWFGVLAESGIIGFLFFCMLVYKIFCSILCSIETLCPMQNPRLYAIAEALLAGIISFLISGTFLTQGFTWPIYIILSLAAAIGHISEKSKVS